MYSDWAPLEQILDPTSCQHFMFMGRSGEIYHYKHIDTRRYLNLNREGQCFRYTVNGYVPQELDKAIGHVFE
jgi:hypothetical protein